MLKNGKLYYNDKPEKEVKISNEKEKIVNYDITNGWDYDYLFKHTAKHTALPNDLLLSIVKLNTEKMLDKDNVVEEEEYEDDDFLEDEEASEWLEEEDEEDDDFLKNKKPSEWLE